MKTLAARIIRTFGFRNMMTVNALISAVFLAACALFTVHTPLLLIMIILVVGGFFRSLEFTAINTVAYAEVEAGQMSRATTLVSVNQQLAISAGVAVGAFSRGIDDVVAARQPNSTPDGSRPPSSWCRSSRRCPAWFFWQMPDDAGHEISGRKAVADFEPQRRGKGAAQDAAVKARPKTPRTCAISGSVDGVFLKPARITQF